MNTPQDMLDDGGALQRRPSEGARIVEKYRPEMNNLTAAEREEHYQRGMQMVYAKWWSIASAPKDGTYILLAGPSGYIDTPLRAEICRYDAKYRPLQPWVNHANDSFLEGGTEPTHWMSLPPAP